jgi:glycosyltransferase involved in cell wall biosynthesis
MSPRGAASDQAAEARVEANLDELSQLAQTIDTPPRQPDYALPKGFLLSVVVPVYNEEKTIDTILQRLEQAPLPKEVIVVDDCSADGTREALRRWERRPGFTVVYKPKNEGKGAALRTGFAACSGDVAVVQDADLEYDPADLPAVIRPIVEGRADVVYGSRFLNGAARGSSWVHRLGNRLLTQASNLFTGLKLTDMETCYKAFRREALRELRLTQDRFGFEPEVTAKVARLGCRVVETPISYHARRFDEGKKIGWRDAAQTLWCIVRYWIGLRKLFVGSC